MADLDLPAHEILQHCKRASSRHISLHDDVLGSHTDVRSQALTVKAKKRTQAQAPSIAIFQCTMGTARPPKRAAPQRRSKSAAAIQTANNFTAGTQQEHWQAATAFEHASQLSVSKPAIQNCLGLTAGQ
jgi:hypothetical protein